MWTAGKPSLHIRLRDPVVASAQRLRAARHRPERTEYKRSTCTKELRIYTKGQAKLESVIIHIVKIWCVLQSYAQ